MLANIEGSSNVLVVSLTFILTQVPELNPFQ